MTTLQKWVLWLGFIFAFVGMGFGIHGYVHGTRLTKFLADSTTVYGGPPERDAVRLWNKKVYDHLVMIEDLLRAAGHPPPGHDHHQPPPPPPDW